MSRPSGCTATVVRSGPCSSTGQVRSLLPHTCAWATSAASCGREGGACPEGVDPCICRFICRSHQHGKAGRRLVRGHEKVPTGGQVVGPRWWPVRSPHSSLCILSGAWALRGDGGGANQSPHRPGDAPLKNSEGTHGHHRRLPRGGHLSGCGRDLRHHAQDGEADRASAHEAGGAAPARKDRGAQLRRGRRDGGRAGAQDRRAGSRPSGCCRRPGPPATTGSARNFRRLVAEAKAAWRRGHHRGRRPGVWAPGDTLVIDWGASGGLQVFCAVLAWSPVRFVRFAADEQAATTLALLAECFEALGGVPADGAGRPDGLPEGRGGRQRGGARPPTTSASPPTTGSGPTSARRPTRNRRGSSRTWSATRSAT